MDAGGSIHTVPVLVHHLSKQRGCLAAKSEKWRKQSMFYITGDTHGEFSRIEQFCERIKPTRDDTMIILGDAGINYNGGWRDIHKKQRLAKLPITLFCIHGNHEMRPGTLPCYHTIEWNGGQV